MTLTNCTVSGNTATGNGGGLANYGMATLTNCTVSGNNTATSGNHYGGGIFTKGGVLHLTNCTIASNTASLSGGGIDAQGPVTVTSSTFSLNHAVFGGAIDNYGGMFTVRVQDSILAGDSAPDGPEFSHAVTSLGNNLVSNIAGSSGWKSSDLKGTLRMPLDPLLAPLGNYGGPTQTMALLPGSQAIGKGIAVSGVTTDQRGVARPKTRPDIGAFQDRGFTITPVAGSSPQSTIVTTAFANPLAVVVASPYGDPVAGGVITFTARSKGASARLSAPAATIGSNGRASVTATANGMIGSYSVRGSDSGAKKPAAFSLSNRGKLTKSLSRRRQGRPNFGNPKAQVTE